MSDHFYELLLQTLKENGVRLERLEGRADHIINEKADKTDLDDVKTELKTVTTKLDLKADKTDVDDVKAVLKTVTTKLDLKAGKTHVHDVKTDLKTYINDVKAELKTDINDVRSELNDVRAELKTDINGVRTELKTDINGVKTELNELRDDLRSQGQRIDRIETGIRTLQWTMTAGLAVLGIIIAFIRLF